MTQKKSSHKQIKQLKHAAAALILLATVLATVNTVFAPELDALKATRLTRVYDLFNTVVRVGFLLYGGILMFRLFDQRHSLRRRSIGSLMISAMVLLCLIPLITGYYDILFLWMPFPWTTYPLQLLYDGHFLAKPVGHLFGGKGVSILVMIYILWQVLIFAAVAWRGRRQFCSLLCPHGAVHGETYSEALPLVGDFSKGREGLSPNLKLFLVTLRGLMLVFNIGLWILWVYILMGGDGVDTRLLRVFEGVKLIGLEFILFYILMIVQSGRGYCYYCPSGTVLSIWEGLFKHGLETNKGVCVSCGNCNANCEMNINVMAKAKRGKFLQSGLCVGCGHCVDSCPTKTLQLKGQSRAVKARKEEYDDVL